MELCGVLPTELALGHRTSTYMQLPAELSVPLRLDKYSFVQRQADEVQGPLDSSGCHCAGQQHKWQRALRGNSARSEQSHL